MNKYQEIMLGCIKEFIRVAELHNITWWVDGGTLLGAIREKGFIEWDTDADIIVPRKFYGQIKSHPEWFETPYVLESFGGTHLKIHNINTTARWKDVPISNDGKPHGINIDIFALDEYNGQVADLSFGLRPNCVWDKEWWSGHILKDFESIKVNVPIGAENILARQYGDWWIPKDGGGSHDNSRVYFSLEKEW